MRRCDRARMVAGTLALAALLALSGVLLPTPALAATPHTGSRPREFVATAQMAVVRLIAAYYAQTTAGPASSFTPLEPCTGLGTIVGTTGAGGNARPYVLTDAHLVSPVQPCSSAQAAYLNTNHALPAGWKLTKVTAYLNAAYTGADAAHLGSLSFDLDISALPTLGLSEGAVVLPLTAATTPSYDLPVIVVPASVPVSATQVLDLGSGGNTPYTSDAITPNALPGALAVIESAAALPGPVGTAAPTPTSGGTGTPPATATAPTLNLTPTPVGGINPGAPVVADVGTGAGQLAGMVLSTGTGLRVAGPDALNAALRGAFAVSNLGAFSASWGSALNDFYAAVPTDHKDPHFQSAAAQLQSLASHYPSFTGVAPWLTAAQAGQPNPTTGTKAASNGTSDEIIPGLPIHGVTQLIAFGLAVVLVLLGIFLLLRSVLRRRAPQQARRSRPSYADDDDITLKTPALGVTRPRGESLGERPTVPLPSTVSRIVRYGLQAVGLTDPGQRRKADPNQDSILVVQGARMHGHMPQPFGLYVVADGMGGHQFGREASSETVRVMADHILQPLLGGENLRDHDLLDLLHDAAQHANESLHFRNLRQHADMGTTVTAALVAGDTAYVINVGDSRTYHLQPGLPLRQVTADHSVVASLVAAGVIGPDDIYTHPKRNQIFRSLGEQEEAQIDTFTVLLRPGDHLLLCSDGLWEMIRNPRLEELLRYHPDLGTVVQTLIDEANDNGGVDNISAVVVRVLGEDAAAQQVGMHVLAGPTALKGL